MESNNDRRASFKFVAFIFVAIFIGATLYLFYPVLECIHNLGGYAEDCDDAFSLFLIPFSAFAIVLAIIFIVSIAIAISKKKIVLTRRRKITANEMRLA
jgi:hypothetical protein